MGQKKSNSAIYLYMRGSNVPKSANRAKLAKILGVTEDLLIPKELIVQPHHSLMLSGPKVPRLPPPIPVAEQVLKFEMDADGNAHIRLDVTLSSSSAIELIAYLRVNNLIR